MNRRAAARTGRTVRVLVLARGEKEREAVEAGADFRRPRRVHPSCRPAGPMFDVIIATPDLMADVASSAVCSARGV